MSQATACSGDSCRSASQINRRSLVQGAAFSAAGLALGSFHPALAAQDEYTRLLLNSIPNPFAAPNVPTVLDRV